jgi:hypothetical protein
VVFELFQDLDGFSLEDYRPFSDLTGSVGRIHDFLAAVLAEQDWALRKALDGLFEVVGQTGTRVARFTDDCERAMATDGLGLLGFRTKVFALEVRISGKWGSKHATFSPQVFLSISITYEIRTKSAKSTGLERIGPQRENLGLFRARPVNRSTPKTL